MTAFVCAVVAVIDYDGPCLPLWQGSVTRSSTAKQPDKLSPVSGACQTVQIEIDARVGVPQQETITFKIII